MTSSETEAMERDGFIVREGVFGAADLDSITARIEEFQQRHRAAIAEGGGQEGISRAEEITFTSHLAERDAAIRSFCRRPELTELARTYLGEDIDLYWNQSVFKMPEGRKQFPWHQDDGYTPVTPSPYLTLWISLNDATIENGCISVLPGSHKRGLVEHIALPEGKACHPLDHPDQGIFVPVPAGSVIAFWSLTMHKSGANASGGPRKAYIVQYSRRGLRQADTGEPIEGLLPVLRGGATVA